MGNIIREIQIIIRKWKNQSFYFYLGVIGLSISLAVLILTIGFITYERQFDSHLEGKENVYLVNLEDNQDNYMSSINLGEALKEQSDAVESSTVVSFGRSGYYQKPSHVLTIDFAAISPTFFQVFPFKAKYGSLPKEIAPDEIVVTESAANLYFGQSDVIGKTLSKKDNQGLIDTYIIRAVLEDLPSNSSIKADVFCQNYKPKADFHNSATLAYNWIRIDAESDLSGIQAIASKLLDKKSGNSIGFTPLSDLHFSNNNELQQVYNARPMKLIYIMIGVTCLILLISIFNNINLSLARATTYLKEIGIRRISGASKMQIIRLFLLDTILLFILSMPLAFLIAYMTFPFYKEVLHLELGLSILFQWRVIFIVFVFAVLLSIPCGLYPAVLMLKKTDLQLTKKFVTSSNRQFGFKQLIITLQFSFSIILILLAIAMQKQVEVLQERPIGFQKEHLLILPEVSLRSNYHAFKNRLLEIRDVQSMSSSNIEIGKLSEGNKIDSTISVQYIEADFDFVKTLGLKLIYGADFNPNSLYQQKFNSDYLLQELGKDEELLEKRRQRPIIVTQDLIKEYGLENPIGKILELKTGYFAGTIIGVVEGFEMGPQQQANIPKIILGDYNLFYGGNIYIRFRNHNIKNVLNELETVWKEFVPYKEFSYIFADQKIKDLYKSENGLSLVLSIMSLISCLLSILGLLSLMSLTIKQRSHEIGIRKMLGATVININQLIIKSSLKPVLLAIFISLPFSYWIVQVWLEDFSYRADIPIWVYLLTAIACIFVTIIVISFQAIRATLLNPVEVLKDE